jgi:hypothetical protein
MMVDANTGSNATVGEYVCDVRAEGDAVTEMFPTAPGVSVDVWAALGGTGWSASSE